MGLFRVKIYNSYDVNVYSDGEISDIFDKVEINDGEVDCIIKKEDSNNNQIQRLLINRKVMLKYKDNWVIHSVSCRLKTGDNLVICGKIGSGKSYFYNLLSESGLIEKLYDEDLIGINNKGIIFSLAKANFKGKVDGEYNYEQDELDFGKINIFVIMGSDDKNHKNFRDSFIESVIHDLYQDDNELIEHYNKFPSFNAKCFIIPYTRNQNRESSIYSVIKDIGAREKRSY